MQQQFNRKHGAKDRFLNKNDLVFASVHKANTFIWQPGKIIERFGNVMYNVLFENGRLIRSHINQLQKREESSMEINESTELFDTFSLLDEDGDIEMPPLQQPNDIQPNRNEGVPQNQNEREEAEAPNPPNQPIDDAIQFQNARPTRQRRAPNYYQATEKLRDWRNMRR